MHYNYISIASPCFQASTKNLLSFQTANSMAKDCRGPRLLKLMSLKVSAVLVWCFWVLAECASVKPGLGSWKVVLMNGGVSAMHMTTTKEGTVVMFDRTDFGPSQLQLDNGRCRDNPNDLALKHDCTAHSFEYDIATSKLRPLMVMTDPWCSSGAFTSDGTLVSTGGYNDGSKALRQFKPCKDGSCDWNDDQSNAATLLKANRWYASNQILPDNRIIVIGGRRSFSYEFVPKSSATEGAFLLPLLSQTNTPNVEDNLYPFVHLSSDGNLFVFANKDSILLDYRNNKVVRTFPRIPGGPRNYPSSGSSVMLPLSASDGFKRVEVLICGGAPEGSFVSANAGNYTEALNSCGRMVITDANANWAMESMPKGRVMGDMLILPNAEDVLIINGAERGTAGWEIARDPALSPYLYRHADPAGSRFTVLQATNIPRVYHSTANVLPDGRVLVGGSNTHVGYQFTGTDFPTEFRLEAYSPYYLDSSLDSMRPSIASVSVTSVSYGGRFTLNFNVGSIDMSNVQFTLYAPPFTTHTFSMNQRILKLAGTAAKRVRGTYISVVTAPPNAVAAPPGYYMLFVVNSAVPSQAQWIHLS